MKKLLLVFTLLVALTSIANSQNDCPLCVECGCVIPGEVWDIDIWYVGVGGCDVVAPGTQAIYAEIDYLTGEVIREWVGDPTAAMLACE